IYLAIGILISCCVMMTFIPTPGYDIAMLEPGTNMAAWVDIHLLPGKMWEGSWDPEGLLSTLPVFATTISGMLIARFISNDFSIEKVLQTIIFGFTMCVIGVFWHYIFPINKPIWSSSYVLVTSGLATIVFSICLYIFDILKIKKWTLPFDVFGTNAIAAYFLAGILSFIFYDLPFGPKSLNSHFFNSLTSLGLMAEMASLLYALLFVSIIFALVYALYKRKIFIKL
ncbi:MAG TPA: hypothetical protein PKD85_20760, partial [Saprospiraceae bacterium]|nr:hypothetical protein [Saprospiraceae bacterium]